MPILSWGFMELSVGGGRVIRVRRGLEVGPRVRLDRLISVLGMPFTLFKARRLPVSDHPIRLIPSQHAQDGLPATLGLLKRGHLSSPTPPEKNACRPPRLGHRAMRFRDKGVVIVSRYSPKPQYTYMFLFFTTGVKSMTWALTILSCTLYFIFYTPGG